MKLGSAIRIEEDVEDNWDDGGFGGAIGARHSGMSTEKITSNQPRFTFVAFQQTADNETDSLNALGQIVITAHVTIEFEMSQYGHGELQGLVSASVGDGPAVQTVNPVKFKSRQQSPSQPLTGFGVTNSRDDKTAIELFIAGVQGWEAGLRRVFPGKSGNDSQS